MKHNTKIRFKLDIQFFAGSEVDVYVDAHKYTIRSSGTITVVENGLQSDAESTPFWVATNVSATRVFAGVSSLDEPDPDFVEYVVGSHITIDLVSSENYFDSRYSNISNILNRSKIISKIQTDSSNVFDIVPNKIANDTGDYYAELPTLTQNETIATGTQLATKQDTLVSGTNIKTINGQNILGSGNITIESGTDLKARYNLGAFDTIDTSNTDYDLITRQTGYVVLGKLNYSVASSGKFYSGGILDTIVKNTDYKRIKFARLAIQNVGSLDYLDDMSMSIDASGYIQIRNDSCNSDVNSLKAFLGNDVAEYQLQTPYTEKVIKNRPLDTLDQNGSMFVRKEWEKGLNLWDEQWEQGCFATQGVEVATANAIRSKNFIPVEPNATYTLNVPNVASNTAQVRVIFYNNSKVYLSSDTQIGGLHTFTTPSNCYYIKICTLPDYSPYYGGTYNNDIMLVEGSHPYPYQPYNGPIVHEKEIQELREKTLYNLGEFDTLDTSNSEYDLITRNGWHFNLSKFVLDNASSAYFRSSVGGYQLSPLGQDQLIFPSAYIESGGTPVFADNSVFVPTSANECYGNSSGFVISHQYISLPSSYNTKQAYLDYFSQNEIIIQYELATPYTEKVIKNRPLDTLDQQGSEFVRKEWEKGLNVFSTSFLNTNSYLTISENNFTLSHSYGEGNSVMKEEIAWKANTQYTFSGSKTNTTGNVRIAIRYTDNSIDNLDWNDDVYSYKTSAAGKTISTLECRYGGAGSTTYQNLMVNEGSHPYPYQPYNGEIVHQKELETKQDTLVSGTNIKTIGGQSILGSGNLDVGAPTTEFTAADVDALFA